MNITVRRISQTKVVRAERNKIDEEVNNTLRDLSYLHELKIENITYDRSTNPSELSTAVILYSYTGVIDELYNHLNEFTKQYKIPINDLSILLPNNIFDIEHPLYGYSYIYLGEAIFKKGYIPREGDKIQL